MTLDDLNHLDRQTRFDIFLACCHCKRWAQDMSKASPFDSASSLKEQALAFWQSSSEAERLEAFSGHPQIGDMDALRNKYAKDANREQGQIVEAEDETLLALRDGNQHYLERYGFIFIVCATGKSASEMLILLRNRISNNRTLELDNAAVEQGKITQLRLANLLQAK